jgi:ribosomal protein S30
MRHHVERYKMLLKTETNPRVRKVLTGMIEELEGRVLTVESQTAAPATVPDRSPTGPLGYFPV